MESYGIHTINSKLNWSEHIEKLPAKWVQYWVCCKVTSKVPCIYKLSCYKLMILEYGSSIWDLFTTKDITALKTFKERYPDLSKMSIPWILHMWPTCLRIQLESSRTSQKAINYNIIWSNIWQIPEIRIWILPNLWGLCYKFLSLFYSEFLLRSLHYAKFALLMFLILSFFSYHLLNLYYSWTTFYFNSFLVSHIP